MKQSIISVLAVLIFASLSTAARAENGERSWSISAGAGVRQIDVDFRTAPPAPLDWRSLVPRRSGGAGSFELYQGGPDPVSYADGTVGLFDFNDGSATFSADSLAQVGVNPNASSAFRDPVRTVSFQSYYFSQTAETMSYDPSAEEEETAWYPYVAVRRSATPVLGGQGGLLFQYAYLQSSLDSDARRSALVNVYEEQRLRTFTYDVDEFYVGSSEFMEPLDNVDGIVYDATVYRNMSAPSEFAEDPRVKKSLRKRHLASFAADTSSELEVEMHEAVLAFEWSRWAASERVSWSLAAGPTLNWLDVDLESQTRWYNADTGETISRTRTRDADESKFRVGVMAAVSVLVDLGKEGRYFFEVSGSYRWVDEVTVGSNGNRADVDVSSFTGSAGVGVRL